MLLTRPENISERYIVGDNTEELLKSIDKLIDIEDRVFFFDTSVFYIPADEMRLYEEYTFGETNSAHFIRKGTQFNRQLAELIARSSHSAIIPAVLAELNDNLSLSSGELKILQEQLEERLRVEKEPIACEIREAIKEYKSAKKDILPLLMKNIYETDEAGGKVINSFYGLLKILDKTFELKKHSPNNTDELIVASALSEAVKSSPAGVISRDNDIHRLLKYALRVIGDDDIHKLFSCFWERIDISDFVYKPDRRPKSYIERYNTRKKFMDMDAENLRGIHFYDENERQEVLGTVIKKLAEINEFLEIGEEPDPKRVKMILKPAYEYSFPGIKRPKKNKTKTPTRNDSFQHPELALVPKFKHRKGRYRRRTAYKLLSRYPQQSSISSNHTKASRNEYGMLPASIKQYISVILGKYKQYEGEDKEILPFGLQRAQEFLDHIGKSPRNTANDEEAIELTKAFVEYNIFLRSIQGKSYRKIPLSNQVIKDFYACLNGEFRLNPNKLRGIIGGWMSEFQSLFPDEDFSVYGHDPEISNRFNNFIAYRAIPFMNREGADSTDRRATVARAAVDEAVSKYGITEANMNIFLKLALQHAEWGISEGYNMNPGNGNSIDKSLSANFTGDRRRVNQPHPQERLYLTGDVFKRLGITDNVPIFHCLTDSGTEPVLTESWGTCGYFVTREGVEKMTRYFEGSKMIDYKSLRGR